MTEATYRWRSFFGLSFPRDRSQHHSRKRKGRTHVWTMLEGERVNWE